MTTKAKRARERRAEQRRAMRHASKDTHLANAVRAVSFPNATIPTEIGFNPDGSVFVQLVVTDRETGIPGAVVNFDFDPTYEGQDPESGSIERVIEWLYQIARYTWLHELNEAMHVDGKRRRDLHDGNGRAVPPPGDRLP